MSDTPVFDALAEEFDERRRDLAYQLDRLAARLARLARSGGYGTAGTAWVNPRLVTWEVT